MGKRILVAVILAPLFFVVLFFLEPVWLAVLMAAISALASFELLRATGVAHHNGMYFCTALAAAAIPLGEWLGQEGMVLQASGGHGASGVCPAADGGYLLDRHPPV